MKITLIDQLNLNKLTKKKNLTSKLFIGLLVVIVYIFLAFSVGLSLYGIGLIGLETLGTEIVLKLGLMIISLLLITTTLTRANAYLFKAKDFDLLSSLSIPLPTIVLTKISSFLIFSYLLTAIIYIPTVIVYALLTSVGILYYILAVIVFLLLPLLIITVFSIVSYLFSLLLSRFKYKNVLSMIFQLLFFVGIMVISFSMQTTSDESMLSFLNKIDNFIKFGYLPAYLASLVLAGNYINIIWLLLISLVPFTLFVYFTSKVYVYVNTQLSFTKNSESFDEKQISHKSNKHIFSLFKMELKKFFSYPIVVVNSLTGKLISIIFGIIFLINMNTPILEEGNIEIDPSIVPIFFLVVVSFMIGLMVTTSATISLEGKSFWILKSLPIKATQIIWSKIMIDMFFSLIAIIILMISLIVIANPPILVSLFVLILLIIITTINAIIGMIVNLNNYNFNWDQPVKVVKQGASVIITMLINLFIMIIFVGGLLALALGLKIGIYETLIIMTLLFACILTILIIFINKKGYKLFNKIPG